METEFAKVSRDEVKAVLVAVRNALKETTATNAEILLGIQAYINLDFLTDMCKECDGAALRAMQAMR